MTQPKNERRAARGLTLTELLVVIAIIVLVSGAMLPTIRPLLKGRNVREASRIVNVFFAGVQAQAIEKQRPMGVWLERAAHDDVLNGVPLQPNHYKVNKLYVAEQPAPYTGDSLDARARVITAFDQNGPNPAENAAIAEFIPQDHLHFKSPRSLFHSRIVRFIRFCRLANLFDSTIAEACTGSLKHQTVPHRFRMTLDSDHRLTDPAHRPRCRQGLTSPSVFKRSSPMCQLDSQAWPDCSADWDASKAKQFRSRSIAARSVRLQHRSRCQTARQSI